MSELRARIVRASVAQGVTTLMGKAINVGLAIVLARLLYPRDYGIFAIAMVVTGFANMVSNFGFQSYIVQAKQLTAAVLNTCYTMNVVLSVFLGMCVAAAGLVWHDPPVGLPAVLALYGVHVFFSGLSYIELALFKRELEFSRSGRVEVASTAVSMGGRVGFALAGFSAMSFPLGDLLGSVTRWILVRRMSSAKLRLTRFRDEASLEAVHFGMHATSVALASFVANQTDKMLLAANHAVSAVGLYTFGNSTAGLFYNAAIVPQTGVFLSSFAKLRANLQDARDHLAASSRVIFSFAIPVSVLLVIESERIITEVFGQQWLPAVPVMRIFAIDYLIRSMFAGITGLQMAFGLASRAARTKWVNALIFVAILLIAVWMKAGIVGYALSYAGANLLAMTHNTYVNGKLIEIRWVKYAANLLPPALIAGASTVVWILARPFFVGQSALLSLLALGSLWLVTYSLLTLRFNRPVAGAVLSIASGIGLRKPAIDRRAEDGLPVVKVL